jgi:hypothetical protein
VSVSEPPEPLKLKPVPDTEALEIFTFALPLLVTVTDCVVALPTFTLPKLKLVGLGVNATVDACPFPLSGTVDVADDALLSIAIDPLTLDAEDGLNCAVKVALLPAPSVYGIESPEALMPDPEVARLEIVIVALPEFASLIVCVASLPTVTVPKLTEAGVIVSSDALPEPVQLAVAGEPEALLVIVIVPESVAVEAGLNVAVKLALCPALSVAGTVSPESVTPLPDTATFEIVVDELPEFVIFTVCAEVVPIATLPKLIEFGESPSEAETPSPFRGTVVGESSALLVIVTTPVVAPFEAALNATLSVAALPGAIVVGAVSPVIV